MPSSILTGAQASLAAFGVNVSDPCDPQALIDGITENIKDFLEEANEETEKVSNEGGGAMFLAVVAIVLQQVFNLGLGMATAYADKLMGNVLKNGIGAMYSMVALLLTSMDGIQIIIQYMAALALKNALIKRIKLSRILETDLNIIASLIQTLITVLQGRNENKAEYAELRKSIEILKRVHQLLSIEYGKLTNGNSELLSSSTIEVAEQQLDEVLNTLSGGSFSIMSSAIDQVTRKTFPNSSSAVLEATGGSVPGIEDWMTSVTEIKKAIDSDIFSELSTMPLEGDAYTQAAAERFIKLDRYAGAIMPILPPAAQLIFVQEIVGGSINRLMTRLPILGGLFNDFSNWTKERLSPSNNMEELFSVEPAILNEPPLLNQEPKLTWKRSISAVNVTQAALLLIPTYFGALKAMGGVVTAILEPAISTISQVRGDMSSTEKSIRSGDSGTLLLSGKKVAWSTKLVFIKNMLGGLNPQITYDPDTEVTLDDGTVETATSTNTVNVNSVLAATKTAEESLSRLKSEIKKQSLNDDGTKIKSPGSEAYSFSQKYLLPLAASQVVLLHPKISKRTLSGIHAILILLRKQHSSDNKLLLHCNAFISNVEAMPNFEDLKARYDAILGSLGGGAFSSLAGELASGDLSGIVGFLDGAALVSDLANLGLCVDSQGVSGDIPDLNPSNPFNAIEELNASLPWTPDSSRFLKWMDKVKLTTSNLKNKKKILDNQITMTEEYIKAVQAAAEFASMPLEN